MITGDNYYDGRVWADDAYDVDASPLLRALHAQLCRGRPHTEGGPVCARAWSVMRRWEADGRPAGKPDGCACGQPDRTSHRHTARECHRVGLGPHDTLPPPP